MLQDLNTDNENRTLYNLLHVSHLYVYYIFYILYLINFASFSFFSPFLAVLVQRKLLFSVQSCQDCWVKFKYVFKIVFSLKEISFSYNYRWNVLREKREKTRMDTRTLKQKRDSLVLWVSSELIKGRKLFVDITATVKEIKQT